MGLLVKILSINNMDQRRRKLKKNNTKKKSY